MKPVLWTTRRLVTSVSVVQRWNQAVTVQYNAASATTAAADRHSRTMLSVVVERDKTEQDGGHDPGRDRRPNRISSARWSNTAPSRRAAEYRRYNAPYHSASIAPDCLRGPPGAAPFRALPEPGCLLPTAPLCIRAFWPARFRFPRGHTNNLVRECTSRHGPPRDEIRRHIRRQYRPHPQRRAPCEARGRCRPRRRRGGVGDGRQDQ